MSDALLFIVIYSLAILGGFQMGRSYTGVRWATFMRDGWASVQERYEFAHITEEPMTSDEVLIAFAEAFGAEKAPM